MKKIYLKPLMTVEQSDLWAGRMLVDADCKTLITESCDVYDKESGKCLAKFRKGEIPVSFCIAAYDNLLKAATSTDSRKLAAGADENGSASRYRIKKDGTQSKQSIANDFVNSGVAGYYDRSPRFPNCRLTAFNRHHMPMFKKAYPIFNYVSERYRELMPTEFKKQLKQVEQTPQDWVIPGTVFTTITVNKNYKTAVHKDAGDFKDGFGNLVAIRKGTYSGCYLTLPRWGVGFDLRNTDLLLMDVHQWHGNTPIRLEDPRAVRLSLVMYYREKMIHCKPIQEELSRAKNRKKGENFTD